MLAAVSNRQQRQIILLMYRFKKHCDQVASYDILYKDLFINVMQLPKLQQIILNTGVGKHAVIGDQGTWSALFAFELITGQRPKITHAKKSIDRFRLREKMPIGCKVSLRGLNAYSFLDRFINIILPSVEDIEGFINIKKTRLAPFGAGPRLAPRAGGGPVGPPPDRRPPAGPPVNDVGGTYGPPHKGGGPRSGDNPPNTRKE